MSADSDFWTDDLLPEQIGPYEEIQNFWNNFVETCHANKNTCLNFYQKEIRSKCDNLLTLQNLEYLYTSSLTTHGDNQGTLHGPETKIEWNNCLNGKTEEGPEWLNDLIKSKYIVPATHHSQVHGGEAQTGKIPTMVMAGLVMFGVITACGIIFSHMVLIKKIRERERIASMETMSTSSFPSVFSPAASVKKSNETTPDATIDEQIAPFEHCDSMSRIQSSGFEENFPEADRSSLADSDFATSSDTSSK